MHSRLARLSAHTASLAYLRGSRGLLYISLFSAVMGVLCAEDLVLAEDRTTEADRVLIMEGKGIFLGVLIPIHQSTSSHMASNRS